ncbi:DNA-processing protein DprA [Alicyclobacillus fastidiosus]|uniref:DNA-processing protein DprA n=1 Tax=Alicyclobacillus fastidiosus TaxID=392011 RepID=A0ABY6ZBM6_9BACL|nr:DNA-processing protein DprA [Alicyclobacillus fastidiosus]WAH40254.1 DNA-processing protein DprA [Alicyclobacillus fastidiosus]GMA61622.1 DNA processing protein DprA [Alicyclobacillus fastidiosus]
MDERERTLRVYWALCPGLEPSTYRKLFAYFGSAQALSEAPEEAWAAALKIRPQTIHRMSAWRGRADRVANRCESQLAESAGTICVVQGDDAYPPRLLDLFDPPIVLFARGNADYLAVDHGVAVVGTRRSSSYGLYATKWICTSLARAGVPVYSGMALGIDQCAHEAVLSEHGAGIAILGCGVEVCYPPSNEPLYRHLLQDGLVLSEYHPQSPAAKHRFPERNRLIAALSSATVVVQAGEKSGALRTAEFALDIGRDVYVVPGPITSKSFRGSHQLLVDGATPLFDPAVLAEQFGSPPQPVQSHRNAAAVMSKVPDHLLDLASLLVEEGPLRPGEIALMIAAPPGHIHAKLLEMELERLVHRLPDGRYQYAATDHMQY